MSTSTAPPASASNLPSDSRSRPFRRLSQLRSYTQNHLSSSSSSSSANPNGQQRSSYRNSFSNRVPWRSSGSHQAAASSSAAAADSESATAHSTNASSCPEPERQSTLARYSSAFFSSYRGFETDLHSQGSSSSRSTPTDEPGASQTQTQTQAPGTMARLRGLTQTTDSRANNNNNNNDNNSNANNDTRPDASSLSGSGNPQEGSVESSNAAENPSASTEPKQKPTMRFFPYQDPLQSARPSLHFIPVSRTLPSDSCVIRVGRYSERDGIPIANPSEPSDAPIGFKSKVVSRKHCELIFLNGQWNIKDVGSSSGTFLNHMRLSQPNMASKLYTVKDGDIVQLGIDFRGGEEMIFRCVRIRIECNRSWQRQPNEFNKNTESLIRNLGKGNTADYSGCRECSICLGSVLRPYQCLFMAACAHVWHYKCVSRLIHTPDYPIFQCPNCRAYTDLSAEVDDSNDIVEEEPKENASSNAEQSQRRSGTQSPALENNSTPIPPEDTSTPEPEPEMSGSDLPAEAGLAVNIDNMHLHDEEHRAHTENTPNADSPTPAPTSNPTSNPTNVHHSPNIDIPGSQTASPSPGAPLTRPANVRSDTATRAAEMSEDNPLTPRNDSGPLAFDGWTGIP